jgi:hypothetical protein
MDKKQQIKEAIMKASSFITLFESDAYQIHLKEYLMQLSDTKWLDPNAYDTQEKFMHDYQYARARAGVAQEIMDFLEKQRTIRDILTKNLTQIENGQAK